MTINCNIVWRRWWLGVSFDRHLGRYFFQTFFGPLAIWLEWGEYDFTEGDPLFTCEDDYDG